MVGQYRFRNLSPLLHQQKKTTPEAEGEGSADRLPLEGFEEERSAARK